MIHFAEEILQLLPYYNTALYKRNRYRIVNSRGMFIIINEKI